MQINTLSALCKDVERGACAIARTDISTTDTAACWRELCQNGVNINGYRARASWVFDQVIARVEAIRRAWNLEVVA